jgi:hypothetical protein
LNQKGGLFEVVHGYSDKEGTPFDGSLTPPPLQLVEEDNGQDSPLRSFFEFPNAVDFWDEEESMDGILNGEMEYDQCLGTGSEWREIHPYHQAVHAIETAPR